METIAITFDCGADELETLSEFWAAALGYDQVFPGYLVDPAGVRPRLAIEVVPEPKIAKNRWHLDLYVDDLDSLEPKARALLALGATEVHHIDEVTHGFTNVFTTLLDPAGNEFCVCAPHVRIKGDGE